jgi:hypothetical protein
VVFCNDYRCSLAITLPADRWPGHARLSDIEPRFICEACAKRVLTSGRISTSGKRLQFPN